MRRTWRDGLMVLLSASLALAPAVSMAQSQSAPAPAVDGATEGQGTAESTKSKAAPDSGKKTGQSAGDVGARLHDEAKGFGEAILGGIKYVGRTIIGFFEDDKK